MFLPANVDDVIATDVVFVVATDDDVSVPSTDVVVVRVVATYVDFSATDFDVVFVDVDVVFIVDLLQLIVVVFATEVSAATDVVLLCYCK